MASRKLSKPSLKGETPSKLRSRSQLLNRAGVEPPAKKQKVKQLTSFVRPPVFDLSGSQPSCSPPDKGKERASAEPPQPSTSTLQTDRLLWVERYEPKSEDELAVHKRKVQDVRQWLTEALEGGPSGKLKKYRRILALSGPAGTGKTTTVRVLARELGFEILEWKNSMDEHFSRDEDFGIDGDDSERLDYEGLAEKFQTFMARATSCRSLFSETVRDSGTGVMPSSTPRSSQSIAQGSQSTAPSLSQSSLLTATSVIPVASGGQPSVRRQVVMLEDLPNILHVGTQIAFQTALQALVSSPTTDSTPLILIVSDAGLRGEDTEEKAGTWRRSKDVMDLRNILSPELINSPYVAQIAFRPIAPTLMRPALQRILDQHFSITKGVSPSKETLNVVVESSNGDIRSAIMALEFACLAQSGPHRKTVKGSKKNNKLPPSVLMEAVTRREQSLALFHLLGKILYNKRKGDPPNQSATKTDIQRDNLLDASLKNPPSLPTHLLQHARRTSRVDVDTLYADSPVDSSLLSLYIQQNYTQYCNTLEECDGISEWLSWIDSSGGDAWYQANPYRFHLLTLGTLHSLPSPVTRRNQQPYKPAFFETLQREHEAEGGIRDVQSWLQSNEMQEATCWGKRDIALELGAIFRARELAGSKSGTLAPASHKLFSWLDFGDEVDGLLQLTEDTSVALEFTDDSDDGRGISQIAPHEGVTAGGWLEDDDIEEF